MIIDLSSIRHFVKAKSDSILLDYKMLDENQRKKYKIAFKTLSVLALFIILDNTTVFAANPEISEETKANFTKHFKAKGYSDGQIKSLLNDWDPSMIKFIGGEEHCFDAYKTTVEMDFSLEHFRECMGHSVHRMATNFFKSFDNYKLKIDGINFGGKLPNIK